MKDMIKKYIPFAVIILLIYMLAPLIVVLTGGTDSPLQSYTPVIYDVLFPLTAVVCSLLYARKNGIDFFFSLVAPVIYIPSMIIYNGISMNNIIFVAIYLVASIFGLFVGDMFFSRKNKNSQEDDDDNEDDLEIDETYENKSENEKDYDLSNFETKSETPSDDEIDKILNDLHKN